MKQGHTDVFQRLQRQEIVNEDLLSQLKSVESRNGFLMVENQEIKSQIQATGSQTTEKEDALSSMQSEIAALRDQFEAKVESTSIERITKIQIQMDEATEENEELKARAQLLKSIEKEVQETLAEKESENEKLAEEIKGTRMELEMSKTMVQEMEARVLQLETSKVNLTKHLQSTQIVASESNETLSKSILEKDEAIASCRSELYAAIAARDSFKAKLAQVTDEGGVLQAAADASSTRVKDLESTSAKFENEKNNLQESLNAVEETRQETCEQKEAVECELSEMKDAHQSIQNSLAEKELNFKAYKEECDSVVQTLMGDMQEAEATIFETKEYVSKLESTKESLEERIDELSSQIAYLQAESADTEEKLNRTRAELSESKKEASEMEDKILEQLEGGEAHTRSAIYAKDKQIAFLTGEVAQATAKILELESELAQADDEFESLEAKLKEMQVLKSKLEEEKRSIVEQKEKIQSTTQAEITALESKLEIVSKELVKSIEIREAAEVESSSQIGYFKSQIDETGVHLTTARREASSLEEEVEALRSSNSNLEQEIQHLSDSNSEFLGDAQAKLVELQFQLDAKASDLMASTGRLNKLQEEYDSARAMYDHTKSVLESQLDQAGDRISLLDANVHSHETAKSLLEEELESLKQAAEDSSTKATVTICKLESQLEKSADELSSSRGVIGSLQEKEANTAAEVEQWRTSNSAVEGRLTKAQEKCAELESQLEETSEKVQQADGEFESLEAKLKEMQVLKSKLEEEKRSIVEQKEKIQSTTQAEITALESKLEIVSKELVKSIEIREAAEVESSSQIGYFKSQIDETGVHLTTARREASSLEEEVEALRSSNSNLEQEIQHLSDSNSEFLGDAQAKLVELQFQLDAKASDLMASTGRLNKLQEEYDSARAMYDHTKSVLESQLDQAGDRISLLDANVHSHETAKSLLEEELESLKQAAEDSSTKATVTICKLESQLEKSADELSSSRGVIGSLQEKEANTAAEVEQWRASNSAVEGRLTKSQEKCAELESQLEETSERVQTAQTSSGETEASLRREINAKSEELSVTVHTLKTLKTEMSTIVSARDDVEAKLATTESLLSTTMSNAISLEEKISSLEDEIILQDQKSMDSISEAKATGESLHSQLSAVEQEKISLSLERELLKISCTDLESKLKEGATKIETLEEVIANLKSCQEEELKHMAEYSEVESARLQKKMTVMGEELQRKSVALCTAAKCLENLTVDKLSVSGERDTLQSKLKEAESQLAGAVNEMRFLKAQLIDSEVELTEARGSLNILEETKLEGDSELRVWEAKCTKAEKDLAEASQRVSILEKDAETLKSNKRALSNEMYTLKEANSITAGEFQERFSALQNELEMKNEELSSKMKELFLLESYRVSIASDRDCLKEKTAGLEIQLAGAREKIQRKETLLSTLESSLVALETRIQTQKNESEEALARAQEELGALESDLEISHLKVTASEEAVNSLEEAKAAVLTELDSIKTQLEASNRKFDQANEQTRSLQDEIDVRESNEESLKKEIQSMTESNSGNSTALMAKISSLEAALEEKLNELSSAKEREGAMNEAKASLEEEMKSLIIEKESFKGAEKSIVAQRDLLEIEVAESRFQLGEAQEIIDTVRSGKQSLEEKMTLVSDQHDEAIAYISLQKTLLESELKAKTEESLYASNSTEVVEQRLKEKATELESITRQPNFNEAP